MARPGAHPAQQNLGCHTLGGGPCLVWRLEAYGDGQAQWDSWGHCQGLGCQPLPCPDPGLLLCLPLMAKK